MFCFLRHLYGLVIAMSLCHAIYNQFYVHLFSHSILQTCLDLLREGYNVYLVIDGISSSRVQDRDVAVDRLKAAGVRVCPRSFFVAAHDERLYVLSGTIYSFFPI
jgi:hypothetical protein